MPLLDLVSLMQILLVFCIGCVLDMQLISALLLIALRVRMIIYYLNVHCSNFFNDCFYLIKTCLIVYIVFITLIALYLLIYVLCIQLVISLMKVLFVCKCFRL